MASADEIGSHLANLDIEDEENEELIFEADVEDVKRYDLCLVRRFLSEKTINDRAMKSKLADVWKPAMGITIKELESSTYLFQFYHVEDLQWVMNGGPWSFDNIMLVLATIPQGENPVKVPLVFVNIWIQIYELPFGFMNETVGKQLGNFFGEFIMYDHKDDSSLWRDYMRVKIKLDVRKPLKRKKKIITRDGKEFIVHCKYERLGEFCFIFGLVSHTDRFCRKYYESRVEHTIKEWGAWLRAPARRNVGQPKSKWFRDDGDGEWGRKNGKSINIPTSGGSGASTVGEEIIKGRDLRIDISRGKIKQL